MVASYVFSCLFLFYCVAMLVLIRKTRKSEDRIVYSVVMEPNVEVECAFSEKSNSVEVLLQDDFTVLQFFYGRRYLEQCFPLLLLFGGRSRLLEAFGLNLWFVGFSVESLGLVLVTERSLHVSDGIVTVFLYPIIVCILCIPISSVLSLMLYFPIVNSKSLSILLFVIGSSIEVLIFLGTFYICFISEIPEQLNFVLSWIILFVFDICVVEPVKTLLKSMLIVWTQHIKSISNVLKRV